MNKVVLTILILLIQHPVFGQEIVRQDGDYDVKVGIYTTKSLDEELIGSNATVIQPQAKFQSGENTAFLKVTNKRVALFDRVNDSGMAKAIGILEKSSVIQVDTIFYKEIFRDTIKQWSLSFNVWYAIKINGKRYYTDYKIHDLVALQKPLPKYDQEFLLVAQSTGYDEYYDTGYPNYFFVVVLNDKSEITYESEILDFDNRDEFWEAESSSYLAMEMTDRGFEFTLYGFEDNYSGIWTGKELKRYEP